MNDTASRISIYDKFAWWVVDDKDHLPQMWNRNCNECDGQGFFYMPEDGIQCPDCHSTGRHCFTLIAAVPCEGCDDSEDGPGVDCIDCDERGYWLRRITVHVEEVLPIYPIFGAGEVNHDRTLPHLMMDDTGAWYLDGDQGIRNAILPTDAAPGKWAVFLAVHT